MESHFYSTVGGLKVREDRSMPQFAIYMGGADRVRLQNFKWCSYKEGELVVGKTYKVENYIAMQDTEYLWIWVINEEDQKCAYYTGYFEPTDLSEVRRKIRKAKLEKIKNL